MDFAEMKQIMEQYFLLLNGKRAMTDDLNLGGNKLVGDIISGGNLTLSPTSHAVKGEIIIDDCIVRPVTSGQGGIGKATRVFGPSFFTSVYASVFWGKAGGSGIYTSNADNSYIMFKARDNDTDILTECARLLSASEPCLGINRAGDIDLVAWKALNALNGIIKLPFYINPYPTVNDCWFEASTNKLWVYNGSSWVSTTLT